MHSAVLPFHEHGIEVEVVPSEDDGYLVPLAGIDGLHGIGRAHLMHGDDDILPLHGVGQSVLFVRTLRVHGEIVEVREQGADVHLQEDPFPGRRVHDVCRCSAAGAHVDEEGVHCHVAPHGELGVSRRADGKVSGEVLHLRHLVAVDGGGLVLCRCLRRFNTLLVLS